MRIDCVAIQNDIQSRIRRSVAHGTQKKLLAVLLGSSKEQMSYVNIKRKLADTLGIAFTFLHIPTIPTQTSFLYQVKKYIADESPDGIIIQQPLPSTYITAEIYANLPANLDIEAQYNMLYTPPIARATYAALQWVYHIDRNNLLSVLRTKHIVIAGNGLTTGRLIARTFDANNIPYVQTTSKTPNADGLYRCADIIITGVGKNIIKPQNIQKGVVLINFGLHLVGKKLIGDYDESAIEPIASYYTTTPGGMGPIDVLCMYENLIYGPLP